MNIDRIILGVIRNVDPTRNTCKFHLELKLSDVMHELRVKLVN